MRYTPAGVAIMEFTVNHASKQKEAGIVRQIIFELLAIAMGEAAIAVAGMKRENAVKMTGFLNRKSHSSQQLIFHAIQIELI
ncbi:MAG: primosomal replication protein N [Nitrosomonas sp.]|nr:MAG: primosomal replication protein N [Nitrosomonas sp.]